MKQRKAILIKGLVQGVGFRPLVYNLARIHNLTGWVLNNESGVEIEVEGKSSAIEAFLKELNFAPPRQAKISSINEKVIPLLDGMDFKILSSRSRGNEEVIISPDLAVCPDCEQELTNPQDRRYHYPFINCINCGPRYTLIIDVPYDRPLTTMKAFSMCESCQAEYDNPTNRRFHAQPNACPVCGPHYWLVPGDKKLGSKKTIAKAIELLQAGETIAIKGIGGFHLAADACNEEAVRKLRTNKSRVAKPFAVMVKDIVMAKKFCKVTTSQKELLSSVHRPIVLLESLKNDYLASAVAPSQNYHGVMLPYAPLHYLLFEGFSNPLVMTSGNISEEPIAYKNEIAREKLCGVTDYFLLHNRRIRIPCDDSLTREFRGRPQILRRSRGYVPAPIAVKGVPEGILAVGAEEKSVVCLTKPGQVFLSHHLTDLKNMSSYEAFEDAITHLKKLLNINISVVVHDLHPEYLSTKYASSVPVIKKIAVQHHFAHIAGCMAEHGIDETVIGLAMDGNGYGTDDTVWGGEVLLVGPQQFERVGHLTPLPMAGGYKAVKEPWRMTLSYLYNCYGEDFWGLPLEFLNSVERQNWPLFHKLLDRHLNSPLTTSMGRFFDAVSALLGICNEITYSGQAAIELEMAAAAVVCKPYNYKITNQDNGSLIIDQLSIFRQIVEGAIDKEPLEVIAARFHHTLAVVFAEIALKLRDTYGINQVCLAGGVFQNLLLLTMTERHLRENGFEVFWSEQTPVNDGGICLGQAWIASRQLVR